MVGAVDRLVIVALARRRCTVGAGQLADAVEVIALGAVFPVVALGAAELGGVHAGGLVGAGLAVAAIFALAELALLALGAGIGRGADTLQAELHRRVVFLGVKERVGFEHLLDFLVQFQRGQLQQADGLLQLGRERQVL